VPASPGIDLLRALVGLDTVSSRSNRAIAELVADRLARPGVEVRLLPGGAEGKVNLWARLGPEPAGDRSGLLLSGHLDVVPADEPDWTSPPFALTDRGDRWVARGACDMKGFVALATELARRIDPARLARPLCLLFTCDEEIGTLGAQHFARAWDGAPPPRAALIGEPTSLAVVRLHKGHCKLRVELPGRPAHSGSPHLGDNAIEKAADVVAALRDLRRDWAARRPAGHEHFPEAPFVPVNVGRIEGGVAINVVAAQAAIELGFRPLPGMTAAELLVELRARVLAAAPDASVTVLGDSPPLATSEDAEIHRALLELTGQTGSRGAPYASDGGPLAALGVEAVLCGPGAIADAHRADEFVPKAELARMAGILVALAERFCGVAPPPMADFAA
jgi:acetylornithine deacetylase